jgi:hypothetical protein
MSVTFSLPALFEAQKTLDKMNVVRNLTGQDTAEKLDYSIFYPAQAATNSGFFH